MASPADYVFNKAPTVGDLPKPDFSWISNLPNDYWQGQQYGLKRAQQTAFANGFPRTPDGGIDYNAVTNKLIQLGGVDAAAPIAGKAISADMYQRMMRGGGGGSIYDAVWGVESGNRNNISDSSTGAVGPGQIMPGTWKQYAKSGENIRNPDDNRAVSKRILDDYMQRYNGDAARAAVAYFSGPGNVAPPGSPTPWIENKSDGNVRTSEYVRRVMANMRTASAQGNDVQASPLPAPGAAQPGTGAPAPVEQPTGAVGNAPFMAQTSTNAGGPANVGGGSKPVRVASANTSLDEFTSPPTSPVSTAEQASQAGGEPANRTPTGAASGAPAQVGQGPSTTAGAPQQVAQATPQAAPQGGDIPSARYTPAAADRLERAAEYLRRSAGALGASGFPAESSKAQLDQADKMSAQAAEIRKVLAERSQQQFGLGIEQQKAVQTADIKRGEAMFNGISAAARQYQTDLKPYLDLTRSIANDPRAYTGAGGQRSLDINRVRAAFGDQQAAMLQEMLTKVRAQAVLNTINVQKDEMSEAGSNSSRLFSQQVQQIEKAVPGLETSLGGNRALVEIASRMGEHQVQVARMAREYITAQRQRGLPGYLDQGFDEQVSSYLKQHPVFTDQEIAHPELLGAPTAPAGVNSKQELSAWGKSLGLSPGDPFRTANGNIRALP